MIGNITQLIRFYTKKPEYSPFQGLFTFWTRGFLGDALPRWLNQWRSITESEIILAGREAIKFEINTVFRVSESCQLKISCHDETLLV